MWESESGGDCGKMHFNYYSSGKTWRALTASTDQKTSIYEVVVASEPRAGGRRMEGGWATVCISCRWRKMMQPIGWRKISLLFVWINWCGPLYCMLFALFARPFPFQRIPSRLHNRYALSVPSTYPFTSTNSFDNRCTLCWIQFSQSVGNGLGEGCW